MNPDSVKALPLVYLNSTFIIYFRTVDVKWEEWGREGEARGRKKGMGLSSFGQEMKKKK